ncbi:hypothetical protein V6Z11_D05G063300 [Gossypium hirsutum]
MSFHQQFVWFFMFLLQNRNLILFWPGWYAADDCEWMGFSHLVLWGYHYHTPNLKCSNLISRLQNNFRYVGVIVSIRRKTLIFVMDSLLRLA